MSRFSNLITPRGEWVKDYPSTNARIIVGIRLAVAYVAYNGVLVALGARYQFTLPEWALNLDYATGVFIASMAAFSLGQFWAKRATDDPEVRKQTAQTTTVTTGSPPTTVKVDTAPQPRPTTNSAQAEGDE